MHKKEVITRSFHLRVKKVIKEVSLKKILIKTQSFNLFYTDVTLGQTTESL